MLLCGGSHRSSPQQTIVASTIHTPHITRRELANPLEQGMLFAMGELANSRCWVPGKSECR